MTAESQPQDSSQSLGYCRSSEKLPIHLFQARDLNRTTCVKPGMRITAESATSQPHQKEIAASITAESQPHHTQSLDASRSEISQIDCSSRAKHS